MCRVLDFSKCKTILITKESKSVDYINKKATPSGKFLPKDRRGKDHQPKTNSGLPKACKRRGRLDPLRKCPALEKSVKNGKN